MPRNNRTKVVYSETCPECGYEWGRACYDDTQATCPSCRYNWRLDEPARNRDESVVIE
jgi:predicted Zn-ribbon and HTH transcriptional regulator